jgi:hypothetical protein
MKKIAGWLLYFAICLAVIITAIGSGKKHGRCSECELAFDSNRHEKPKFADAWLYKD